MTILMNGTVENESEDGDSIIKIPILKDGNTENPKTWVIANSKGEKYAHDLAVNYIEYGDKVLTGN